MKRILTFFAVLAILIAASSAASAQTAKKDYDLKGFTAVEFNNEFKATVLKSNDFSVSVELPEELVPYLDVRVSKGALIVELRNVPTKLNILKTSAVNATVTMPELRGVTLNGAAKLAVPDSFDLGNGDFTL